MGVRGLALHDDVATDDVDAGRGVGAAGAVGAVGAEDAEDAEDAGDAGRAGGAVGAAGAGGAALVGEDHVGAAGEGAA